MPVVVEPLVIAIDGPGGSGKSTVAASLATAMSLPVLSTGVFFRAVAWGLADTGVDDAQVDDWFDRHSVAVEGQLGVVDGVVLTDELRSPVVQVSLSKVAASPRVRSHVLDLERREIERLGELRRKPVIFEATVDGVLCGHNGLEVLPVNDHPAVAEGVRRYGYLDVVHLLEDILEL